MEDIITTETTEGDMEAVTETLTKEPMSELIIPHKMKQTRQLQVQELLTL